MPAGGKVQDFQNPMRKDFHILGGATASQRKGGMLDLYGGPKPGVPLDSISLFPRTGNLDSLCQMGLIWLPCTAVMWKHAWLQSYIGNTVKQIYFAQPDRDGATQARSIRLCCGHIWCALRPNIFVHASCRPSEFGVLQCSRPACAAFFISAHAGQPSAAEYLTGPQSSHCSCMQMWRAALEGGGATLVAGRCCGHRDRRSHLQLLHGMSPQGGKQCS